MPPSRKKGKELSSRPSHRKVDRPLEFKSVAIIKLTKLDPETIQWWTQEKSKKSASNAPVPESPSRNLRSQQQRYGKVNEPGTSSSPKAKLSAGALVQGAGQAPNQGTNSTDTIIKVCKVQGNRIVEIERKVRATPSTSKPAEDQRSRHTTSTEKTTSPAIKPQSKRTARKSIRKSSSSQGSSLITSAQRASTSGTVTISAGTPPPTVKKVSPVEVRTVNNSPKRLSSTRLLFPGSKTAIITPPSPDRKKIRKNTSEENEASNVLDSPGKAERRSILWDILPEGRSLRSTRIPTEKMAAFKSNMERNKVKGTATKAGSEQSALQSRFHTRRTTAITGRPPTPPQPVSSTTDASPARGSSSLSQSEELSTPETCKHNLEGNLELGEKNDSVEVGSPKQSPAAEEKHDNIFSMLQQWERKGTVAQSSEGHDACQLGDPPTESDRKGADGSNQTEEMKSSPTGTSPSISPTTRFKISVFKLKCPTTVSQPTGQTLSVYGRPNATVMSTTIPSNFVSRSLTFEPKVCDSLQDTNESSLRDKPVLVGHDTAKTEKRPISSDQNKPRKQGADGDLLCEEQMCDSDEFDSPKRKKVAQMLSEQGASSDSEELVPDVDDISGVMFVSFSSKQAISAHSCVERETREKFGNELDKVLTELGQKKSGRGQIMAKESPDSTEAAELYDKIATYERLLRAEVKRSKSREIVHPELSRKHIGLSHSPTLNLKELGVDMDVLQSPPRDSSPRSHEHCDGSQARVSPQGSILASILMAPKDRTMLGSAPCVRYPEPSSTSHQFVSRTGKTTDITKIKGWKSKLDMLSSPPKLSLATSSSVLDRTVSVSSTYTMPSLTKVQSVTRKPKKASQTATGKVTKKKKATGLSSIPEGSSIKVVSKEMVEHWKQSGKKHKKKKKALENQKEKSDGFRPFGRWRPPKTPDHPTPPLRQFTSNVVTATMALKAVMAVCTSPQDMNMEEKESHHAMVQKLENPQEEDKASSEGNESAALSTLPPCGKVYCRFGCLCDSLSSGWEYCNDRDHCNEPSCMLDGCRCGKSSPESRRVSILKDDLDDASNDERNPRKRPRRRVTAKSLSFFNAMNYEYYPEFSTSPPKKKKSRDIECDYAPPQKKKSPESGERSQSMMQKTGKPYIQMRDKKTGKFVRKALVSPQPPQQFEPSQSQQRFKQIKAVPLSKPLKSQQTNSKSYVHVERRDRPEPVVESVNTRVVSRRWIEDEDRDDDITMTCARARVHRRTAKTRPCSCGIKHHHHHNVSALPDAKKSTRAKTSPETKSKSPQIGKKVLQGTKSPKETTNKHEGVTEPSSPQRITCVKVFKPIKPKSPSQSQATTPQDKPEVSGQGKPWMGRTMQIGPGIIGALATANSSKTGEQNLPAKATVLKLLPAANPNAPKLYVPVSSTLEKIEKGAESTPITLPKLTPPRPAAIPQEKPSVAVKQSAPAHTSSHGSSPTAVAVISSTKSPQVSPKPGHLSKIPVVTVPQYPQSQLILIEQKTTNPNPGPGKQTQQVVHSPKLVEIISTCNWDSARNLILKMIAQQSQSLTLPRVFQVADFFVEVMGPSQERRIYNLPANLLQTLPPRIQSARVKIWKQAPLKTGKHVIVVPPQTPQAQANPTSNPDVAVQNQAVPIMAKTSEVGQQANAVPKEPLTAPKIQVKLTAEQAKQKLSESTVVNKEEQPSTLQENVSDVPSQGDVSAIGNVLPTSLASNSSSPLPKPEESGISTVGSNQEHSGPVRDEVDVSDTEISKTTMGLTSASSETATDDVSASSVALLDDKETPARSSSVPLIQEKPASGDKGGPEMLTHDEVEGGKETTIATEETEKYERQEVDQSSGSDLPDDAPTSTKVVTTTSIANHGEVTAVKTAVEAVLSTKQVTPTRPSISSDSALHVPSDGASTNSEGKMDSSSVGDVEEGLKDKPPSLSMEVIVEDNSCSRKIEVANSKQRQLTEEKTTENNTSLETTTGMDSDEQPAPIKDDENSASSKLAMSKSNSAVDTTENATEDTSDATLQKQSSSQVEMKSLEQLENVTSDPAANADDVARGTEAGKAKIVSGRREEDSQDSKGSVVQDTSSCNQQKELTEMVSVDSVENEQESASQTSHDKDADKEVDKDADHNQSTTVTRQVDNTEENQPSKVLTSGTFIPENPLDSLITRVAASLASAEKAGNDDPIKKVTSTGTFVPANPLLEADESESSEESEDSTSSSDSSSRKEDLSSDEEESTEAADESPEEHCKDAVDSQSVEGLSKLKVDGDTADDDKATDPPDDRTRQKESSKESEEPSGGSHAAQKHEIPEKTESPKKIATSGIFVPTVATDEQNQWLENQATHTSTDQHHETRHKEQKKEGEEAKDQSKNGDNGSEEVVVVSSEEDNVDVDGLRAPSVVQKRKADTDLVDIVADDEDDDDNTPASVKLRLSIAASGEVINPQCSVHSLKVKKKRKSVMEEFEPDDVEFIEKGREEIMAEAAEAKKSLLDRRLGVSRLLHISNERRRRKEIKDLFGNLKVLLGIPREDDRVANIHVLRKSKEVIDKLKRDESRLSDVKLDLLSQREKLIKRLASSPQSTYSEAQLYEKFMLPSEEPGFFDDRSMSCEVEDTKSDTQGEDDSRSPPTERTEIHPNVTWCHFSPFESSSKRKESPPKASGKQTNMSHLLPDASQEESSVLQQEFLKQLKKMKKGEELPEPEMEPEIEPKDIVKKTAVKYTTHSEKVVEVAKAKPLEKETQETTKRKFNEEDATKRTDAQGGRLRKKARKSTFRKTNVNRRTITPQQLSNLEQTHSSRNNDRPRPGADTAKSQNLPDSRKGDKSPAVDSSIPRESSVQQPRQSGPAVAEGTSSPGMQTFTIQGGLVKSLTNLAAAGAKKPNILRTTRPQTPTLSQETTDTTNIKGGSGATSCVKMSASGVEIVPAVVPKTATIRNVPILQLSSNAPRGQPIFLENCDFLPAGGVIAVPIQGASSSTVPIQGGAKPTTTTGQVHLTTTRATPELVQVPSTLGNSLPKQAIKVVSVASSSSLVLSGSSVVTSQNESAMATTTTRSETKVPTTSTILGNLWVPSTSASNTAIKLIPVGNSKGIGQAMRFSIVDKKTSMATPVAMVSSVTSTSSGTSGSSSVTNAVSAITIKPVSSKECQVMKSPRVVTLPVGTVLSSKVQGQVARTGMVKLAPAPAKLAPAPAKLAPTPISMEDVTMVKDLSKWTTLHMQQDDQSGFLTAKMKLKGAGVPGTRNGPRVSPTLYLEGATGGVVSQYKKPNTEQSNSGKISPATVLQKRNVDKDVDMDGTVEHDDLSHSSALKAKEADQSTITEVGDTESKESMATHSAATGDPREQKEVSTA
ncbi:Hypp3778 [Branchiostoma lanceolatum]|uniref:Hypp3778 protein n=1 Tax=Branchiostoma lanceolatum TaxID=7740 RepID=A0A8K0A1Q7_BRALA|nr:Hypp3778 [Branchiostoma lanceolatum]